METKGQEPPITLTTKKAKKRLPAKSSRTKKLPPRLGGISV